MLRDAGSERVAEIVTRRTEFRDRTSSSAEGREITTGVVLGRNWLHLRDGRALPPQDRCLVVTTRDAAAVGDVVVAKGVVRTDRDLGSGYTYKVLVEDAVAAENSRSRRTEERDRSRDRIAAPKDEAETASPGMRAECASSCRS